MTQKLDLESLLNQQFKQLKTLSWTKLLNNKKWLRRKTVSNILDDIAQAIPKIVLIIQNSMDYSNYISLYLKNHREVDTKALANNIERVLDINCRACYTFFLISTKCSMLRHDICCWDLDKAIILSTDFLPEDDYLVKNGIKEFDPRKDKFDTYVKEIIKHFSFLRQCILKLIKIQVLKDEINDLNSTDN